jgi:hypothetical protein
VRSDDGSGLRVVLDESADATGYVRIERVERPLGEGPGSPVQAGADQAGSRTNTPQPK